MAPTDVKYVEPPVQFDRSQFGAELVEVDSLGAREQSAPAVQG
jgi:hypothetical protein